MVDFRPARPEDVEQILELVNYVFSYVQRVRALYGQAVSYFYMCRKRS